MLAAAPASPSRGTNPAGAEPAPAQTPALSSRRSLARAWRGQTDARPPPPAGAQHADRRTTPRHAAKRGTACADHICRRNGCAPLASNTVRPRELLPPPKLLSHRHRQTGEGPGTGAYGENTAGSGTDCCSRVAPPAPPRSGARAPTWPTQRRSRRSRAGGALQRCQYCFPIVIPIF